MDQMERKPGNPDLMDKPFVGFVVILFVALFVGGWLYVDSVRGEMEMRIDAVASEAAAAQIQARDAAMKIDAISAASAAESGTSTPSDQAAPAP